MYIYAVHILNWNDIKQKSIWYYSVFILHALNYSTAFQSFFYNLLYNFIMLYRAMRCKLGRMVSLSRRRTLTKILLKVDIPVHIDQREVAFCYFTQIVPIDRKEKNKRRFRLKR